MQRAVLGVEHFVPFVNLQGNADVACGEMLGEVRFGGGLTALPTASCIGGAAAFGHAQIQVHKA